MTFIRTSRYAINPDQVSFIDFGQAGADALMVVIGTHALTFRGDDAKSIRDEFPDPAPVDEIPHPTQQKVAIADAKAREMTGGKQ